MADERTSVLVVGAGLAGCAAAAFLAGRGVDVVLVERRPSPSIHPRVVGQSERTVELLRMAGIVVDGSAAQPDVERILLAAAEKAGATIRFSTEAVDVTQDTDGVTARLLNRWNERLTTIRADYLVAADGHRGRIRERLGIGRHGAGVLTHRACVVFDAPDRQVIAFDYHPDQGESILDFTTDHVTELIRQALAEPELAIDVQTVQAWEIGASVADRFRDGRVLLAGDAAEMVPPNGTVAGDAAIADAYDIAWRLADVLSGAAGPALLDDHRTEATGDRAPDVRLIRDGARISTVDLFGDGWTLLTGVAGGVWHSAAEHVARDLGVRLVSHGLGPRLVDVDGRLAAEYGIGESGACLVRPDGVVAWRCGYEASDPVVTLSGVLRSLLGRTVCQEPVGP